MELYTTNTKYRFKQRIYSNDTMRKLKLYMDKYAIKFKYMGYDESIKYKTILLKETRLREEDELTADIEHYLEDVSLCQQ